MRVSSMPAGSSALMFSSSLVNNGNNICNTTKHNVVTFNFMGTQFRGLKMMDMFLDT